MSDEPDYITLEELEKHLTSECGLTIIEPMRVTTQTFHEQADLDLLHQFPTDNPCVPEYDHVMLDSLENELAAEDLYMKCAFENYEPVGEPFKTARHWCLRVKR